MGCAPLLAERASRWHIGVVLEEKIVKKPNKKPSLRHSFPPYYLGVLDADVPLLCYPGDTYEILERSLMPTGEEVRQMLLTMRRELRWSRPALAAFMGVSRDVIRRWETGQRNPNGAARRLIWVLNQLAFHPKQLKSAMDLIFWGRGAELRRWNPGRKARKRSPTTG